MGSSKQDSFSVPTTRGGGSMENLKDGFGFITSISSLLSTRSYDRDVLPLLFVGNETVESAQTTRSMFKNFLFENRAVYDVTWKNFVQRGRPQMAIWHMRIVC